MADINVTLTDQAPINVTLGTSVGVPSRWYRWTNIIKEIK